MGTPAGIDYDKYDEIVRKVFTDEEIEKILTLRIHHHKVLRGHTDREDA
jgi:hypothetical protein